MAKNDIINTRFPDPPDPIRSTAHWESFKLFSRWCTPWVRMTCTFIVDLQVKKNDRYVRDKRSPNPKSEFVSRVMSANRSQDTKPEILVRKALWKAGIRGYRLHLKKVPGRPDISFPNRKIAIFINGCFWHRCPRCNLPLPKSNGPFWKLKFDANQSRDKKKILDLKKLGWKVITVWECEVNKILNKKIDNIKRVLKK